MSQILDLHVVHVLLEPPPGWTGEQGYVTTDVLAQHLPDQRADFEYQMCGPTPLTVSAERSLGALSVPASRVHSEIFDCV